LLLYILWQQRVPAAVKWLATFVVVVLIVCIGLSRIYLRVHYVSDVLAGFSMGLAWLVFSLWLLNRLERGSSRQ
jgi:undecaprenyl-diphosphatase